MTSIVRSPTHLQMSMTSPLSATLPRRWARTAALLFISPAKPFKLPAHQSCVISMHSEGSTCMRSEGEGHQAQVSASSTAYACTHHGLRWCDQRGQHASMSCLQICWWHGYQMGESTQGWRIPAALWAEASRQVPDRFIWAENMGGTLKKHGGPHLPHALPHLVPAWCLSDISLRLLVWQQYG